MPIKLQNLNAQTMLGNRRIRNEARDGYLYYSEIKPFKIDLGAKER